jgi:hypothetical protein
VIPVVWVHGGAVLKCLTRHHDIVRGRRWWWRRPWTCNAPCRAFCPWLTPKAGIVPPQWALFRLRPWQRSALRFLHSFFTSRFGSRCWIVNHLQLKSMLRCGVVTQVLGVRVDKEEQKSTWGVRPLRPAQLQYAAVRPP